MDKSANPHAFRSLPPPLSLSLPSPHPLCLCLSVCPSLSHTHTYTHTHARAHTRTLFKMFFNYLHFYFFFSSFLLCAHFRFHSFTRVLPCSANTPFKCACTLFPRACANKPICGLLGRLGRVRETEQGARVAGLGR